MQLLNKYLKDLLSIIIFNDKKIIKANKKNIIYNYIKIKGYIPALNTG